MEMEEFRASLMDMSPEELYQVKLMLQANAYGAEATCLELKAIREEINHLARIQKAQNDILLRILRAH